MKSYIEDTNEGRRTLTRGRTKWRYYLIIRKVIGAGFSSTTSWHQATHFTGTVSSSLPQNLLSKVHTRLPVSPFLKHTLWSLWASERAFPLPEMPFLSHLLPETFCKQHLSFKGHWMSFLMTFSPQPQSHTSLRVPQEVQASPQPLITSPYNSLFASLSSHSVKTTPEGIYLQEPLRPQ